MKTKEEMLRNMSTRDKALLFTGKNSWELEEIGGKNIFLSDGPHGIRKEVTVDGKKETVKAVCYPAASLSACSFDVSLMERLGEELAKEAIRNGIDVLLGPGINIKRNPRCGRNFEYFSEDPVLSGKLAAAWIRGLQKRNVGASLKHFCLNSQEKARFINDSICDERALREIYVKAFEIAIREAAPWTVMASYNRADGVHTTESKRLLTDILRKDFGFKGAVISDWGAIDDPVSSIEAGLDLEMPGISKGSSKRIKEAVENGELSEETLNESTMRLLELYEKTSREKTDDFDEEHALALAKEIAEKSMVLLRNRDDMLPLDREQSILIAGDFAEHPRYQGGGSSEINTFRVGSLLNAFDEEGIPYEYARGYDGDSLEPDEKLLEEAEKKAAGKDAVIIMCGLPRILESEGYDRDDLDIPLSHIRLIERIWKVNRNIVLVLQNGSPVAMPFLHMTKAVLETYLGGSMHAEAIRDILFGKVNPSGRLAETFPFSYDDVPSKDTYLSDRWHSLYKESIYVGYRWYDRTQKDVLFPFGFGLSYSETEWEGPEVTVIGDAVMSSITIRNLSDRATTETVEIYAGLDEEDSFRAPKELKAFTKVELASHEEKRVTVSFMKKDLSYWSLSENRWVLREGTYRVFISRHAKDESLSGEIRLITGERTAEEYPLIYSRMDRTPTDKEFFSLLSHEPDLSHPTRPFEKESPMSDILETRKGRLFVKPMLKKMVKNEDPNERKMFERAIPDQPVRSVQLMLPISKTGIEGILDVFNGHLFRGLKKMKAKDDI